MEEIKIKILENGRAREVNPLGERPYMNSDKFYAMPFEFFQWCLNGWQEAESKLREFDVFCNKKCMGYDLDSDSFEECVKMECQIVGSIHSARVEGDKVIIT